MFQVFQGSAVPILGLATACELKMIKRIPQREYEKAVNVIKDKIKENYLENE